MKILVSHPTGNSNVRAVIDAFSRSSILSEYNTTIATDPNASWLKVLPKLLKHELLRRRYDIDPDLIKSFPFKEIGRLGFNKMGIKQFTEHESGKFSVDKVYGSLDNAVAKRIEKLDVSKRPDAVYAYEDGALATFKKAKALNITRIYDLPIGYWRAERDILGIERSKRPDWAMTLTGFRDSEEKLNRKDFEIQNAEHIVVASSFTKSTLEYYPGKLPLVSVIPYGFPEVIKARSYNFSKERKLRVLFVGGLSQRKGIAEVLEAADILIDSIQLTIVGRKGNEECLPLNAGLQKNRYIPSLTHSEVLNEMKNHDILLFPSLFEGFGLVVTEAMSQGTPVITTNRTCGADLITHNTDGWLVEASSTDALVHQIRLILESPEIIEKVGRAAMEKARSRPWAQYGIELVEYVKSIHQNKNLH